MNCKICDTDTDVKHEINRMDVYICESCTKSIFYNVAMSVKYNKTIFDIGAKKQRKAVEVHPEVASEILNYLYHSLLKSKTHPDYTPETVPKSYLQLISTRINDGATVEELKTVCYFKHKEWRGDRTMSKYLRAGTLFLKSNFEKYLAEHGHKIPEMIRVNNPDQRTLIKELNSYGARGMANEETDALAKKLMETGYNNKIFLNQYLINKI